MKILKLKPVINKKNGQINFSLSKKVMGKEMTKKINDNPTLKLKMKFEGWDGI